MKDMKVFTTFLSFLFLVFGYAVSSLAQDFSGHHIKRIAQKEGLSSGKVNVIYKDAHSFVWLGTDNGLNRFDGKTIDNICITDSCQGIYVRAIFETPDDRLWVGGKEGIFYFDRKGEQFIHLEEIKLSVNYLTADQAGNLIIGASSGAYILPKEKKEPTPVASHYGVDPLNLDSLSSVSAVLMDSKGLLWVGSWEHGISLIDHDNKTQQRLATDLGVKGVLSIKEGPDGSIWVGAYERGLLRIFPDRENYRFYQHDPSNPNSLNNNRIKTLSFDKRGYLWIGLEEGGLDRLAPEDESFTHYLSNFQGEGLQEGYSVYSTFIDDQDQIWIGFRNDGLQVVPLFPSIFEPLAFEEDGTKEEFAILSLWEEEEMLWLGLSGGLRKLSKGTKVYQDFALPQNASPLSITGWNEAQLLVGTMTGELFVFDKVREKFSPFLAEEQLVIFNDGKINSLYPYSEKKLFIGARTGTYLYDTENRSIKEVAKSWTHTIIPGPDGSLWFINFGTKQAQYFPETGKTIVHSPDVNGNVKAAVFLNNKLYVGSDLGLFEYDLGTQATIRFSNIFPYKNNQVNAMLLDKANNIWFSSVDGIIRMNTANSTFRCFDRFDGVPDIRFRDEIAIKFSDGRLAFGGSGGVALLSPEDYRNDRPGLQLAFTDLLINGVSFQKKLKLENGLSTLEQLTLKKSQGTLAIQFSLLSYTNPEKHRYQYRMANGNPNWIDLESNQVGLINMPTGRHELLIRAADENGNWTEEKNLKIRILPPLLLRWYFLVLYLIGIGGLIYLAFRLRSNQLYMEKEYEIKHLKLENIQEKAKREAEFHNMRLLFFTNISHEFRTPLTLILAPLEKSIQKGIAPSREHLKLMYKNAERLRRLIGQILDFRKMEAGELQFEPTVGDLVKFTRACWKLFEPLAQKKQLTFEFKSDEEARLLWFDKDKFEKIIINLLSNAFKFTEEGSIVLRLVCEEAGEHTKVEIKVTDTGKGISAENLPHIFDRFYHTKTSMTNGQSGTGIGLSLVKEMTEMHQGTIEVESEAGVGTSFVVHLLLENVKKNELHLDGENMDSPHMSLLVGTTEEAAQQRERTEERIHLPTILVVEDDTDLRDYIKVEFGKSFTIIEAADGEEGVKQAYKFIPDLIVSDISMPEMDGLAMSETLKKDERTSHIPIILLTAHGAHTHQKQGFQIGVEDFILKPFSADILEIRINNLLQSRKDLQDKFSKELKVEPSGLPVSSMDQTFLNRAMEVIEQNLNNPQFSAIVFAEEMCMSRVHLYRKLKALTNESVSGFVKVVRLKLAAELIRDKKMRIKEAAYTVGYSDPKYFSKCFKQQFGVNPSEYAEGAVEEDM